MEKKRNGQALRLIIYVCITLFGLVWMFVDVNKDKKSTSEILDDFDKKTTIESHTQEDYQSQNNNIDNIDDVDDYDDHSKKIVDYNIYNTDQLPDENQDEDKITPETYDKTSTLEQNIITNFGKN